MKKRILFILLLIFSVLIQAQQRSTIQTNQPKTTEAQSTIGGKFFGSLFSDYYYVVADPSSSVTGSNSFVMNRVILGYDYTFNKDASLRVSYDAAGKTIHEAFAKWDNIFPMNGITMGVQPTMASQPMEKLWNYRGMGEMMMTRLAFASEYDLGVSLNGKLNPQGTMYYNIMAGNGNGASADTNKSKKVYGNFGMWLDKTSLVDLYVDYEGYTGSRSKINIKGLFGMTMPKMAFGLEALYGMHIKFNGTKNRSPLAAAFYSWFEMMKGMRAVARVDFSDNDLSDANVGYREIYVNGGFDWMAGNDVHLIPSVSYVKKMNKKSSPTIKDHIDVKLTAAVYFPTFR